MVAMKYPGPPEADRVVPLKKAASLKALKRQYLEIYHRAPISEAIFGIACHISDLIGIYIYTSANYL